MNMEMLKQNIEERDSDRRTREEAIRFFNVGPSLENKVDFRNGEFYIGEQTIKEWDVFQKKLDDKTTDSHIADPYRRH